MYIGRVTGTVVSTIQHPLFDGRKLLLVTRLNLDGSETDTYDICVDAVQAGVGDVVLVLDEGGSARQIIGKRGTGPLRAVIMGIVEQVDIAEQRKA
ncbi:MAG: EutN/CcmL family microcompartment protein [Chloroflexi bacterium]|nr:EutN/CcmL family microcompartment protein [Chloroflexota bacterium]